MSRTHNPSCDFNSREISPIPLDRRDSFCGAEELAVLEELRKNLITLSETDAIDNCNRWRQAGYFYDPEPVAFPVSF
jgi:hypothetical protein